MRVKRDYFEKVKIPERFTRYLWDYKEEAPLEMLIFRVLKYGSCEEIEEIFNLYPNETYRLAMKYPDIKRGVKFWIKRWKNLLI